MHKAASAACKSMHTRYQLLAKACTQGISCLHQLLQLTDGATSAICKASVSTGVPSSTLKAKGSSTINQASETRKDSICTMPGEVVHQECRRKYCHPFQIAKDTNPKELMPSTSEGRPVLRSSKEDFSFKTDCFFCGRPAKLGRKRKHDVLQV